jgi:hypothetical protein
MSMRIDHVMIGARRLADVRNRLWAEYGLGLTDRTANGDGTDSWLVPFDGHDVQYLEVIVVTDESIVAASEYGRILLDRTAAGPSLVGWAVAVDDIEAAADRVRQVAGADPELTHGESVRADGQRLPWSEAGFAAAWAVPSRPFFLRYGDWPARRARLPRDLAAAGHRRRPTAIVSVTVLTARGDLLDWLGEAPPWLVVRAGGPEGLAAVRIAADQGSFDLRLDGLVPASGPER